MLRTLFAITAFVAASLLFMVQPMVGRMLLPALGGSAVVWNTAMVFYQAMLLLGYVYAHLSTKYLGVKRQPILHAALMLAALAFVPIGIQVTQTSLLSQSPIGWLLWTLFAHIGLPFFVVSAAAPMLQRWYASTDQDDASNPYHLYAASNAGSLIALMAYPLVMEPLLPLSEQGTAWAIGFGLLIVLTLTVATTLRKHRAPAADDSSPPPWARRGIWVFWSFVPSSLLLGVTHHLTADLASVPMLWVIPLIIYLASFVLAFGNHTWCSSRAVMGMTIASLYLAIALYATHEREPIYLIIAVNLGAFAMTSLVYHRALYDNRPSAAHLTDFYIWVSVGGVAGGAFNALVAPAVFDTYFEYPLTLAFGLAALTSIRVVDIEGRREVVSTLLLGLASTGIVLWISQEAFDDTFHIFLIALMGIAPFVLHLVRPFTTPIVVGVACLLVASPLVRSDSLLEARSPYGAYRVVENQTQVGKFHMLVHGWTNHGSQSLDPRLESLPISYYHPTSPMGKVVASLDDGKPVVVVGLGAGVLAAYGKATRPMTFFEIDPVIAAIASDPKYFTYIKNCGKFCTIKVGDGRLLMQDIPDGSLGLLVLDAYNSDAIPIHLITLEALDLYLSKLAPGGIILFHISNKYIHLENLVANLAAKRDLAVLRQQFWLREAHLYELNIASSDVMIVAQEEETLMPFAKDPRWTHEPANPEQSIWTDDYANVLTYLGFKTE